MGGVGAAFFFGGGGGLWGTYPHPEMSKKSERISDKEQQVKKM